MAKSCSISILMKNYGPQIQKSISVTKWRKIIKANVLHLIICNKIYQANGVQLSFWSGLGRLCTWTLVFPETQKCFYCAAHFHCFPHGLHQVGLKMIVPVVLLHASTTQVEKPRNTTPGTLLPDPWSAEGVRCFNKNNGVRSIRQRVWCLVLLAPSCPKRLKA